jgi:2'-5' RNA ligase
MTGRWRCFVAAPIPPDLRASLAEAVAPWGTDAALRWSAPESWHLTLAFLGGVDPATVGEARARVLEVAGRHEPMRLEAGGIGAFPSAARSRVVWYGVEDPGGRLAALAGDLAGSLGLDAPSPFRAHVTLARVRRGSADLRGWLAEASASAPTGSLEVRQVELMRSHLGQGTPRYETLATMELGGSGSG